ncbi:DNA adenine methylase [Helicobacter sp. T3_23-1059]
MTHSLFDDCIDSSVKSCDKPHAKSRNKSTLIKSPLRYPGGKSRAVAFLARFLPKDIDEFREPFFGGGSFSLYLAQNPQYAKTKIYANDLNSELFCFWQSLQTRPNELISGILELKNRFQNGRDLYRFILARRESNLDTLTRAIDFFILNRITFSGVVDSGGYSQKAYEGRFTLSSVERLAQTQKILGNIAFSNADYAEFLLGKSSDNKRVFLFLDPPYFSASKSKLYGKKGILHTSFDHQKLCERLKSTKHKFLLTYDNSAFIRELYRDFYLLEWDLQYGMNNVASENAPKGKELLISNFELAKRTLTHNATMKNNAK